MAATAAGPRAVTRVRTTPAARPAVELTGAIAGRSRGWTSRRWEVVDDLIASYWPAMRLTDALGQRLRVELGRFRPTTVVDALDVLRAGEPPSIGLIVATCKELEAYAAARARR